MSDERRYGHNSHLWRRTYGYARRKPNVSTFVDSNLNVTRSFDLNETLRHRDFFEVEGYNLEGPDPDWLIPVPVSASFQYESGMVYFDNESEKTVDFSTPFDFPPYVVYMPVENDDNSHNVNAFGTALPTLTQLFIGVSAPFTGYVYYIAMAGTDWPQPYTYYNEGILESTHVWAGEFDANEITEYTASYSLPAGGYNYVYYDTIHENFNSFKANTYTENISVTETNSVNTLSSDVKNKIHFIAFRARSLA